MKVIYSQEEIPESGLAMFLAGPSPRSADVRSWRPEAIEHLSKLKYDGLVFNPELRNPPSGSSWDYDAQVDWEYKALMSTTAIVFWVPRDLKTMPGFTTNVEFGMFCEQIGVFYGRPPTAEKCKYLDFHARRCGIKIHEDLFGLISDAALYLTR